MKREVSGKLPNCEYLSENGICGSLIEEEGKAIREEGCINNIKNYCCYLCDCSKSCSISCNYLSASSKIQDSNSQESQDSNAALQALNLNLLEGEEIVETWPITCEEVREVPTQTLVVFKGTAEEKIEFYGYLLLTTDRLVFVASRGFFNMTYRIKFGIPYEEIASVRTGKYLFSTFVEVATQRGDVRRFKTDSELKLGSRIKELSVKKMARVENEKKKERVQLVLDFSFLRPLAEKGVIMQAITCPHCGGKVEDLPSSGNIFECKYCGDKIYAVDIYREINRLLGYTVDQIPSQLDLDKS